MSLVDLEAMAPKTPFPGGKVRFIHTSNMTIAFWQFEKGTKAPVHSHPHEQVCNVTSGEFELEVDGKPLRLSPGKAAVIAPNIPHGGVAITDCTLIDIFHPVREDLKD